MRSASETKAPVAPRGAAHGGWRVLGWCIGLAVGVTALGYGIYVETASTDGEYHFRARGCVLCHGQGFFDESLPALRDWQPGQALTPRVASLLAEAHPHLAGGDGELAAYVASRQLTALAARHAQGEGERLYRAKCAACHGADGLGQPGNYPPLRGSDWLRDGDKLQRLPAILSEGLQGPIEVNRQRWDATMNAPGLRDEGEREAVMEYVRNKWGAGGTPPAGVRGEAPHTAR